MTQATVQGDVLEWALEDAGLDRNRILEAVGLNWWADKAAPLSGPIEIEVAQLEFLAQLTHRSTFFFALPSPPAEDRQSVGANFRAPMSNLGQARPLNPDERLALREAKRRQQISAKVSIELEHAAVTLLKVGVNETPERAAARVADWLHWGSVVERRRRIKSKTQLFVSLRGAIEGQGIMTNLLSVEGDSLRGFSLHHDHVPLIFVNGAVKSAAARSFTLLHELGHLLRGVDKACDKHDLQSRTSEEAWCNRFAAAFLLPRTELSEYMEKRLSKSFIQGDDTESIRRISNYFYCSWYSVAIRLKQLGLGHPDLVVAVSGDFQDPEPDGFARGGQTRAQKRMAAYGPGFARIFESALSSVLVSEMEVRKIFRLSGTELRSFFELSRGTE